MAQIDLKPMSVGDILDEVFRLYRQRLLTFVAIALITYAPYALTVAVVHVIWGNPGENIALWIEQSRTPRLVLTPGAALLQSLERPSRHTMQAAASTAQPSAGAEAGRGESSGNQLVQIGMAFLAILLYVWIVLPLGQAAMAHNLSAGFLGTDISAGRSYLRALPRYLPLLATQWLAFCLIGGGFILLVVPAIVFGLWFMLLPAVVVLEGRSFVGALVRSRQLMAGNLSKGFALLTVIMLLTTSIELTLTALVQLIPWPHVFFDAFCSTLIYAAVVPLQIGAPVLLYYDLRIRKEGLDLEHLALQSAGARP